MILHIIPVKICIYNAAIHSKRNDPKFKYQKKKYMNWWYLHIQVGFTDLNLHLSSDETQWLCWTWPILPFISANFSSATIKQEEAAVGI